MGFAYDDVEDAFDDDFKFDKEYLKIKVEDLQLDENLFVDDYRQPEDEEEDDESADKHLSKLL